VYYTCTCMYVNVYLLTCGMFTCSQHEKLKVDEFIKTSITQLRPLDMGRVQSHFFAIHIIAFNYDISAWDVSKVTDVEGMFIYMYTCNIRA
jgi:hypothetical protein